MPSPDLALQRQYVDHSVTFPEADVLARVLHKYLYDHVLLYTDGHVGISRYLARKLGGQTLSAVGYATVITVALHNVADILGGLKLDVGDMCANAIAAAYHALCVHQVLPEPVYADLPAESGNALFDGDVAAIYE